MKLMLKLEDIGGTPALVPATETDAEIFAKFRRGTWYKSDVRKARNPDHHRKGFALIKLILESQERYETIEDLLVELKLRTGWFQEHVRSVPSGSPAMDVLTQIASTMGGDHGRRMRAALEQLEAESAIHYLPKSISFADMDQLEFETFYDRVLDIAIQSYGLEEAIEFLGD